MFGTYPEQKDLINGLGGADFSGAKAVPGDYIVKLSTNGVEISKDLQF